MGATSLLNVGGSCDASHAYAFATTGRRSNEGQRKEGGADTHDGDFHYE